MNAILSLLANTPVPRDLPLPLPLPEGLLKALLVLFFLIHIFFVNLTVGGSVLVSIFEWMGFRRPRYDRLALTLAKTVTVNKSLAVVMGIGPLLCINLVYTAQWYGANALTGHAWLLIVPLVTVAFLLTYLHKYTWERWSTGRAKKFHWAVSLMATALFLCIPFVFLANVNLMLFPGEWEKVKGFFSSLQVGNVLPRYLHFMLASIAITGLFCAGWMFRKETAAEFEDFTRHDLRRTFYRVAANATACQFLAGPLLLFTLPHVGPMGALHSIIWPAAALGLALTVILWRKAVSDDRAVEGGYGWIVACFSLVVLGMGSGRHVYREAALATHKEAIRTRSHGYEAALAEFNAARAKAAAEGGGAPEEPVQELFAVCAACHAPDQRLVGPSLKEIAGIYAGNPGGIVTWAMAPGKKRPDFPPMPPFSHLGEEKLHRIAEYLLETAPK